MKGVVCRCVVRFALAALVLFWLFAGSAFAGIGSVIGIGQGFATSASSLASIKLLIPLSIVSVSDLQFGRIAAPESGSVTLIKNSSGAITGGTAAYLGGGWEPPGVFYISGDSDQTINITLADIGTGEPGLRLSNLEGGYQGSEPFFNTNSSPLSSPPSGSYAKLEIGGTLTIDSDALTTNFGVVSRNFLVTVEYN